MTLAKPKILVGGLATGPNDLDAPPGNFIVAENVVHRRDGILEPLPNERYYTEGTGWQYSRVFSDWEPQYALKLRKKTADSYAQLMDPSDAGNTTAYAAQFQPGEVQCVYADRRHILSGAEHVVVVDNQDNDVPSAPRRAGLPQVCGLDLNTVITGVATNPTVIPSGKVCGHTAIIRRKLPNDRILNSAPCSKIARGSSSDDQVLIWRVFFETADSAVLAGDEILLFRTDAFDSVAEINDTYYLACAHTLTAGEITAKEALIEDRTPQNALGEELYTNLGQQSSLKANLVPPTASCVESYMGATFYANKRAQPAVTATVRGSFGVLPLAIDAATRQERKNGIGTRLFTGTITALSHNITNVSEDDRIGLAVGQSLSCPGVLPDENGVISAISAGPAPYTITVSGGGIVLGTATTTVYAYDTVHVLATQTATATVYESFGRTRIGTLVDAQENLRDLITKVGTPPPPSLSPIHGFVLNAGAIADYTGTVTDERVELNLRVTQPGYWDSFTVQFSNPDNWVEGETSGSYRVMNSIQETRRNVVWYSKTNLPEDVGPLQYITIGNGTVYRLLNVQSTMLALCSDGLFRVDGQGDNWSVVPVDTTARLVHPDCVAASGQLGFAWLEQGLCTISETGVEDISKDAIGPQLKTYAKAFYSLVNGPRWVWGPSLVIDRHNHELWLNIVLLATGQAVHKYATYIFNTDTGKYTTAGNTYTALSYFPSTLTLLRAKNGFSGDGLYRPSDALSKDYLTATVVYAPFVENAGEVKQWVDVNYFFDNVPETATGLYRVEALFGGELSSGLNLFDLNASQAPGVLFALHSLVPQRCARDVKLVFGFRTRIDVDADHPSGGYYFEFKGASVRTRRASQVIKR